MKSIITIILGVLVVFAWGPWVNGAFMREKLSLTSKEQGDCVFQEIVSASKTAFGYTVLVNYVCNETDNLQRKMFVSSFGKVFVLSKVKDLNAEPLY